MGKKKSRNPTSQKKCEPPSSATPATQLTGVTSTAAVAAAIKTEYDRALNALRRGNPTKALKLLKEATPKFQKEAIFHRHAAGIVVKRHLKTAVDYARNAVALSPNSVEFACLYATLLLDVANEPREYDELVAECERALAVENPNDPATEVLERDVTVSLTAEAEEARIAAVHNELKNVAQRANIANMSAWVDKWGGNGEDNFELTPVVRRPSYEDSGEVKFLFDSEIARPPKTIEEKRKEIEVRVAAARLIRQRSEQEAVEKSNEEDCGEEASCSGSTSPIRKYCERRRFSAFSAMPPFPRG